MSTTPKKDTPHEPRLFPMTALMRQVKVLPATASMKGDMFATADVSISLDGQYEGKIELEAGTIHIAAGSKVTTELCIADYIYVEGLVKGKLHARKGIEFGPKSMVSGDIQYDGDIDIHSGARISAQLSGTEPEFF